MFPCRSGFALSQSLTESDVSHSGPAVSGSPTAAASADDTAEDLDGTLRLPEVFQRHFQLSTSAAQNQLLRAEFYYEQVSSVKPTRRRFLFPDELAQLAGLINYT